MREKFQRRRSLSSHVKTLSVYIQHNMWLSQCIQNSLSYSFILFVSKHRNMIHKSLRASARVCCRCRQWVCVFARGAAFASDRSSLGYVSVPVCLLSLCVCMFLRGGVVFLSRMHSPCACIMSFSEAQPLTFNLGTHMHTYIIIIVVSPHVFVHTHNTIWCIFFFFFCEFIPVLFRCTCFWFVVSTPRLWAVAHAGDSWSIRCQCPWRIREER